MNKESDEHKYRFFFTHMPVAAVVSNNEYTIVEWNRQAEALFGYTREEALGQNLLHLLSSDKNDISAEGLKQNLQRTLINRKSSKNVNYDRTKDGRDILCEWHDLPYSSEDTPIEEKYIFSVARDVTEDKRELDSLTSAVEQKDLMMQEIHHRLKNNLTMITSLINMKMQEEKEEDVLGDVQRKICTVSAMYEKLYKNDETTELEIGSYLEELIYSLFTSLAEFPYRIETSFDKIFVEPETAIALGLITNEIGTNALKYGYAEGEELVFSVSLKKQSDTGGFLFSLSNTGEDFPEDVDFYNSDTLGIQLIHTLVLQLNGDIELRRSPLTEYRITIPATKVLEKQRP